MFSYKGEDWQIKDRTSTVVYASRPGKRGRPSKFTVEELVNAGVVLPEMGVQAELPVADTSVADPAPGDDTDTPVVPQSTDPEPTMHFSLF
jgi:hypothetical protein